MVKVGSIVEEQIGKKIVDKNMNLLEEHIIDSFDVVNIVAELEENFSIELSAEDIVPENFSSLLAIEKLVSLKRGK